MARPSSKDTTKQKPAKKNQKKKGKKRRVYQIDKVRLFIWAFIIIFLGVSILSIFNSLKAATDLKMYREKVEVMQRELDEISAEQKLDIPTTDAFLKDFLSIYFSASEDREQELKRKEELGRYYTPLAFQAPTMPRTTLQVTQIQNYGYQQEADSYVGTFFVETKSTEEEPQSFQTVVSVKFKATKKGYQIVAAPYQQSDIRDEFISSNKGTERDRKSDVLQDSEAREQVESFLDQFMKEYQADNRDNLQYLMKEVEGLPSNVTAETKDLLFYGTADRVIVDMTLVLQYKETGIVFQQGMELHLIKNDDNKYFVDEIIHY